MKELNLPPFEVKLRRAGEQSQIFDEVRKKWLVVTPEEWVRQHFVHFLHNHRGYPLSTMSIEKGFDVHGLKRRADIVCYDKQGKALLIVECKAPEIALRTSTFAQAAGYNHKLQVPFLVITNGSQHYCARINLAEGSYAFEKDIPIFSSITS